MTAAPLEISASTRLAARRIARAALNLDDTQRERILQALVELAWAEGASAASAFIAAGAHASVVIHKAKAALS